MTSLKTLAVTACAVVALSTPALAEEAKNEGVYISAGGGASFLRDSILEEAGVQADAEFDTGFAVSGAVGYRFAEGFRIEAELGYREHDLDNIANVAVESKVSALSAMANAYYDIQTDLGFTPYVGAGLGISQVEVDPVSVAGITLTNKEDDTVFAYAAMAGINVPLTDEVALGFEYKYFGTEDPDFSGTSAEIGSHTVGAKLSYNF